VNGSIRLHPTANVALVSGEMKLLFCFSVRLLQNLAEQCTAERYHAGTCFVGLYESAQLVMNEQMVDMLFISCEWMWM
jgi:hypothetical protein